MAQEASAVQAQRSSEYHTRELYEINLPFREIFLELFPEGTGHYSIYHTPNPDGKYLSHITHGNYNKFHLSVITQEGQEEVVRDIQAGAQFLSLLLSGFTKTGPIKTEDLSDELDSAIKKSNIKVLKIDSVDNRMISVPDLPKLQEAIMAILPNLISLDIAGLMRPAIEFSGAYDHLKHLNLQYHGESSDLYGNLISEGFWSAIFPKLQTLKIAFPYLTGEIAQKFGDFFTKTPELRRLSLEYSEVQERKWDADLVEFVQTGNPLIDLSDAIKKASKLLFLNLGKSSVDAEAPEEFMTAANAHPSLVFLRGMKHEVLDKFESFIETNIKISKQATALMSRLPDGKILPEDLEGLPDKLYDVLDIFSELADFFDIAPIYFSDSSKPLSLEDGVNEDLIRYLVECMETSDRLVTIFAGLDLNRHNTICANSSYATKAQKVEWDLREVTGDVLEHDL